VGIPARPKNGPRACFLAEHTFSLTSNELYK
jgi:hypothetical protein